jgi:hypothetical protein
LHGHDIALGRRTARHGKDLGPAWVADEPRVSYLAIESEGIDWRLTLEERVTLQIRRGVDWGP